MIGAVIVAVAMLAQVVVVNRLPLPWDAAPDLVLLVVVAWGIVRGAVPGALIGFCVGMVADVVPPAAHAVGQYALVYAVAGYLAGRVTANREPGSPVAAAILCGVAGPVLGAAAGALLGDPRITVAAMVAELPPAMVYNLLAAPPVVLGAMRLLGERSGRAVRRVPAYRRPA
ncbi:rod shape-determining protein MreD [Thermocatellispora tengchongensis]|uniref:Rod shape-determining protein MreD n=1 Tax=Thermocatellispora tengchongensis TaxID=1073253 RepID=A0A840P7Q2_9ACTN|nr:rod shape-determining protein MreD [Thermocatellispora tengchongensis]MBB5135029.1 rod shape-determining protein MreD [Thermocatellispora tengchongensis]